MVLSESWNLRVRSTAGRERGGGRSCKDFNGRGTLYISEHKAREASQGYQQTRLGPAYLLLYSQSYHFFKHWVTTVSTVADPRPFACCEAVPLNVSRQSSSNACQRKASSQTVPYARLHPASGGRSMTGPCSTTKPEETQESKERKRKA